MRGANFVGVHELLDTIVAHAGDWADTAAERIVALGLPIDARMQTVAAKAKATEVPGRLHPVRRAHPRRHRRHRRASSST